MKTTSAVLVALLVLITFPIWIGLAGGIFGLIGGILGAIFGIFGAIFGAIASVIGSIFGGIFDWHFHPRIHVSDFCTIAFIIVVIALLVRSRDKQNAR